ncbi:tyrosine-protein phosphatase [Agrococcus baldri]|uniref:Phosphotyrosine protein phosphatase n=1 Tax=Agrococcus baldri TaxID=153730 RepID=A0AA87RLG3_9MICO|nr:tyrosine-protein phosphatase [Agrococcus baldri]GEK81183.1 putative phosphotyrosine protein phosphatase [Agrococcus baldri]
MTTIDTAPGIGAIPLSAPVNLRDLGGIAIPGGAVRPGFAIRADDLATVTDEVADELVAGGLRAVIDLRSSAELALTGRGPLGERASVSYHHLPFMADIGTATAIASVPRQHEFGAMYLHIYESAAPQIVTALAIMAHAPGATAFHCAAGQDRTGVLAASLLLALGAEPADIVADYVRTGENSAMIHRRIAPVIRPLMERLGFDLDAVADAAFSDAPMRSLLRVLDERHGDPLAPLQAAGLTDGLIARLRERALEADAA